MGVNRPDGPPLVAVIGPSGCGKTTIGTALARALDVPFVDGDDLHPAANLAKMTAGTPLDDADRRPWLEAIGRRPARGRLDADLVDSQYDILQPLGGDEAGARVDATGPVDDVVEAALRALS